jgi:hypothetical protein
MSRRGPRAATVAVMGVLCLEANSTQNESSGPPTRQSSIGVALTAIENHKGLAMINCLHRNVVETHAFKPVDQSRTSSQLLR